MSKPEFFYEESAFDPNSISDYEKHPSTYFARGSELLVSGANSCQSPFLVLLRVYFFWQLFQTGQGKLAHIEKQLRLFRESRHTAAHFKCLYGLVRPRLSATYY